MTDIVKLILKGNWLNRSKVIIEENKPDIESIPQYYKAEYSASKHETEVTIKYFTQ